jgi:hypothetical protein
MPNLQSTSSRIQQRFQVWPLRSDLFVFTRSFEPPTHTSLNASMDCSHSQRQKTQNLEALSSNNILKHRTQINSYQVPTKPLIVTASHAKTTTDFWLQTLPSLLLFQQHSAAHSSDAVQDPTNTHSPLQMLTLSSTCP